MRDWIKPLRKAYYGALVNQVFIDLAIVPVWQDKLPEDEPSTLAIVIGETSGTNMDTFDRFMGDVTINIEIIALGQSEVGDYVDDMADQVKGLITTTRTLNGLTPQAGFAFTRVSWDNETDIPMLQTATGYIKRKIIRYRQHIIDNN